MKEVMYEDILKKSVAFDVLEMMQDSVALLGVYDPNEVLRFTNEAFRRAYFIDAEEKVDWETLMRRNFAVCRGTIIETDDIESWISSVRSRRGKSRQRTYESDLHDGRFIWVTETMREDGWIIYVGTDVTSLNASKRQLRLANEKLFRQSITDELTGVSNRRHILSKLQDVLDAGHDAWACLLDIDHFKCINDTYGHQVGDDVLVGIAQTTRKTLKLQDAFGRVGGEEFLVLFASQSLDAVQSTLRRLRHNVKGIRSIGGHPEMRISISGGLTYVSPADTQAQVLRRTDLGLYSAKRNGRNQIRLVEAGSDPSHQSITLIDDAGCMN